MWKQYGNTIAKPCIINGENTEPKLLGKKTPPTITCTPNNTQWIRLSGDGGKTYISFGPETLKAVNAFSARFLQVLNAWEKESSIARFLQVVNAWKKQSSINIVEHLISCLMALKITDIDIATPRWIPVVEAGSSWYFNALKDHVIPNHNRIVNEIYVDENIINQLPSEEKLANGMTRKVSPDKSVEYTQMDHGLERKFVIQKDTTLTIEIQQGKHNDVMDLEEEKFTLYFGDKQEWFEKHMAAKPIARTKKILPYMLLQIFSKMTGSKAIWPKNYTMIYPRSTKEQVWKSMKEQYREGHNEYCAHTAASDVPAELYAALHKLWWVTIDCKISLSNTNHLSRMKVINQILADELFSIQR